MTVGKRIEGIDSLRGLAALYVLLYHTALIPSPALSVPSWARSLVMAGGTGVTLFFVTSAFSLCLAARPGEERGWALAAFAARRFFRIAPLYYVILAVSLLRDWWLFSVVHSKTEILADISLLFNLIPGQETGIVWASWTIGVEVLFYAVFPFMAARMKSLSHAAVFLMLSLLGAMAYPNLLHLTSLTPAAQASFSNYGVLHYMPVFVSGMFAYRIFHRFVAGSNTVPVAAGAALLLGAAYFYSLILSGMLPSGFFHDIYYWQAILYCAVILGVAIYPTRLLVNRVTLNLGTVSYSLYLVHPLVVYALIPFYRVVEAHAWRPTITFGLCVMVTCLAVTAVANLTFRFIEAPGMRIGTRLSTYLTSARTSRQVLGEVS